MNETESAPAAPYKSISDSGSPRTAKPTGPSKRDSKRDTAHYKKRDTSHYLQYYQSSLADGRSDGSDQEYIPSPPLTRQTSGGSTSSSGYSSDMHPAELPTRNATPDSISKARLRSSTPSDGGSDRRRMAIVQMDSLDESPPKPAYDQSLGNGSVRSRRGLPSSLAGLALVAPPDAAPRTYSHLTPPSTAPITGDTTMHDAQRDAISHHRSTSEAVNVKKKSTRDLAHERRPASPTNTTAFAEESRMSVANKPPVLHHPHTRRQQSRSPSPKSAYRPQEAEGLLSPLRARPAMARGDTQQSLILTPEIGEEKEIGARVAAPVVINLSSAEPYRQRKSSTRKPSPQIVVQSATGPVFPPNNASTYLHYQPGVHATAGPLPPPPRAMFNIDTNSPAPPRPPRLNSPLSSRTRGDLEAVKQALQLPPQVSAALASRAPRPSPSKFTKSPKIEPASVEPEEDLTTSANNSEISHVKSDHRREGAFPPSAATSSDSDTAGSQTIPVNVDAALPQSSNGHRRVVDDAASTGDHTASDEDVPRITVVLPLNYKGEQRKHEDSVDETTPIRRQTFDTIPPEQSSPSQSPPSLPPPAMGHTGETPSPPPKSFRNSLTTNLRRFSSIPRSPSISSKKSAHRSSGGTQYSSRTPSPSMAPLPLPRQKIKSQYPSAMFCTEITSRKTSMERCILYAQKINELYMYDSGLGDWTIETKLRANTNRPTVAMSAHTFTPQPRHTSRASMISEASFPRRPDASTATDLSIRTNDLAPATPPTLPYPSLVGQRMYPPRSTSSIASGTPPSSIRSLAPSTPSTKTGGFFASLGRKASLSSARKDRAPPTPSTATPPGTRLLTKNPPAPAAPRTINIANSPSVPGGPRAAPNHRVLRSQTIMTTTNPFSSNSPVTERSEALARRPSLANIAQEPTVIDISADPEFARQVDKLADLLPHADREVLAGYLRRAGQDILAIGQYLEDEKNGIIKT